MVWHFFLKCHRFRLPCSRIDHLRGTTMKKLNALMLLACISLLAACDGSDDAPDDPYYPGYQGSACGSSTDCYSGLRCTDSVCTDPIPNGSSQVGGYCEEKADCAATDLLCEGTQCVDPFPALSRDYGDSCEGSIDCVSTLVCDQYYKTCTFGGLVCTPGGVSCAARTECCGGVCLIDSADASYGYCTTPCRVDADCGGCSCVTLESGGGACGPCG